MSRRREQRPIPAARCGTRSVLATLPIPFTSVSQRRPKPERASIQVPCSTIGGSGSRSSNVGPSMSDKTLAAVFRQPEAPMACSSRTSIGAYLTPLLVSNPLSDTQRERERQPGTQSERRRNLLGSYRQLPPAGPTPIEQQVCSCSSQWRTSLSSSQIALTHLS